MLKDAAFILGGTLWGLFIMSDYHSHQLDTLNTIHLNSVQKSYFTGCVSVEQPDILRCREKSIAYKEEMKKALGL